MLVRELRVQGFRNLAPVTLAPTARFNVFWGDNGHGKTNILEAVYFAGTLRSFRTTRLAELIAWGADTALVEARAARGGEERTYEVTLRSGRRQARLDGKAPRSLGDYFGDFNVVLFSPEDLGVLRGSPAGRRRLLDRAVFNRYPSFLEDAQRYAHVLKQRNALLRKGAPPERLLDVYDEQLAQNGERVDIARRRYLEEIRPRHRAAFVAIAHSGADADVRYDPPERGPGTLIDEIRAARPRDVQRGHTGVGPHTDDVQFLLDGKDARAYASQGQLRALVLAWKAAEMDLLVDVHGDSPLLLLDDVSSELDPLRNQYLFELLVRIECQCLVTTTHPRHVLVATDRQDYRVVDGEVRTG